MNRREKMANIIPMAGSGRRFQDDGYLLPKPLIPVSGKPMIIQAIQRMPKSDKWIFIVRKEHIDKYRIDELIKKEISGAIIVPVEKDTGGQACTCMLAEPYIDKKEEVLIAACDNAYLYDKEKYNELKKDKNIDSIIFTFTQHITLKEKPNARGWCVLGKDGITVRDVSVKKPISNNPFYDHAVVATFFFRTAKDFFDAVRMMIKEDYRINNEFYVDAVPIFMNKLGKKSVIFDIDYYLDWGYPESLYQYQEIEYLFKYAKIYGTLDAKKKSELKKYFSRIDRS